MGNKNNELEKPDQEDPVTLLSIARRLYRLYRPHFGWEGKKRRRTLWLSGIVLGNTLLAFSLAFVNVSMASLMGLLSVPGVTYTSFFYSAGQCIAAFASYGFLTGVDSWMASLLGSSLAHAINKKLEKRWMKNEGYHGIKFNPAQLISHDNYQMNTTVMELFDNFLTTVSNFAVGLVGLYTLSVPLEISLLPISFVLPGYLVASTVIYALAYNSLTNRMGNSLEELQTKQRELEEKVRAKANHIKTYHESIVLKKGTDYEHQSLWKTIKQAKVFQTGASRVRSLLSFTTNLHGEFTSFFALLLCAPNIISQKLSFASVLEIPYHFQNMVNFVTWGNDNADKKVECAVTLKLIEECNEAINQWENVREKSNALLKFSPGNDQEIRIKNLSIKSPDGTSILTNYQASIPKGMRTRIADDSGAGKTTFGRALMGVSPYAKGEIEGLTGNTHFIPSQPYFPIGQSLLDAILYPRTEAATLEEIEEIKSLMKELKLKPETINNLELQPGTINNLGVVVPSGEELSDGEKQRIQIIAAAMKKPKSNILFLDETTARVDPDNKYRMEKVLKRYFPKATIIFTDHKPSVDFADNEIYLAKKVVSPA